MLLFAAIAIMIGGALLAASYWDQLFGQGGPLGEVPFEPWLWAGLIVPSVGWLFLNTGLFWAIPPLIPEIAKAQSTGGNSFWLFGNRTAPGLLAISSFWTAVTFANFTAIIVKYAESRAEFALTAGVMAVIALPVAGLCSWGGGLAWSGIALLLLLVPVVHCTLSLAFHGKPVPIYARAIARLKLGKYREAEQEVVQQLEKRADDFEGWMMLAELYAAQFGDLAEADRTVRSVCDQANVTSLQVSLALHRLADWHLKFDDNPAAARRALVEIVRRLPETHFAKMAHLRLQQIPESRQQWLEQKQPRKVALPALTGELDAPQPQPDSTLSRSDVLRLVNECVDRLKKNPNEVPSRERLASLLAEGLGKADLGIEQLNLLLGMPNQADTKKAEWLSKLAAWHLRYRQDRAAARRILEQLIHEFPQSVQGFAAQRWLNLLEMEERTKARTPPTPQSSVPRP